MEIKKDIDINNNDDYEYTVVLKGNYLKPSDTAEDSGQVVERANSGSVQGASGSTHKIDQHKLMDRLYYEYEKMCLKEPTVLDKDDAYPHSYHWRIGDRYDPAKIEVLEEALSTGKKIVDTEAYLKYVETVKNRRFTPVSWD